MTQQPHATQPQAGGEQTPQTKPPVWGDAHQREPERPPAGGGGWAVGGVTFAGVLMMMHGVIAVLQGIAAITEDEVYASVGDYIYRINLTGWGWILLCVGVFAAVTGWGILMGAAWARVSGIVLASLSAILQFVFLPYAPVWSVIMIAIDVFVIWALAVYRPERTQV